MKKFITKYCLTKGIFEAELKITSQLGLLQDSKLIHLYYFRGEYFDTKEEAIKDAEERRVKKLQSLDKQIKKISKIKFHDPFRDTIQPLNYD